MSAGKPIGFGLSHLPRIVRGEGSYLFDAEGRQYLDGSGGPAAFCLGHICDRYDVLLIADEVMCGGRALWNLARP